MRGLPEAGHVAQAVPGRVERAMIATVFAALCLAALWLALEV
jgi:hypothetical protein